MNKDVLIAGIGWITAGLVSLLGWLIEDGQASEPANLLYVGVLVIVVGTSLLILNKKIETMVDAAKRRAGR
jgi:hypothetical protein